MLNNSALSIPNVIHKIWFGIMPDKYLENISQWRHKHQNFTVKLWYRASLLESLELNRIKDFCQQHSIILRDIDLVDDANYHNLDIVKQWLDIPDDKLKKSRFAAASDVLRTSILATEGGHYSDTDVSVGSSPLPCNLSVPGNAYFLTNLGWLSKMIFLPPLRQIGFVYSGCFMGGAPNHPMFVTANICHRQLHDSLFNKLLNIINKFPEVAFYRDTIETVTGFSLSLSGLINRRIITNIYFNLGTETILGKFDEYAIIKFDGSFLEEHFIDNSDLQEEMELLLKEYQQKLQNILVNANWNPWTIEQKKLQLIHKQKNLIISNLRANAYFNFDNTARCLHINFASSMGRPPSILSFAFFPCDNLTYDFVIDIRKNTSLRHLKLNYAGLHQDELCSLLYDLFPYKKTALWNRTLESIEMIGIDSNNNAVAYKLILILNQLPASNLKHLNFGHNFSNISDNLRTKLFQELFLNDVMLAFFKPINTMNSRTTLFAAKTRSLTFQYNSNILRSYLATIKKPEQKLLAIADKDHPHERSPRYSLV